MSSFSPERISFIRDHLAWHFKTFDLANAPSEFKVVHEGLDTCADLVLKAASRLSFPVGTNDSITDSTERLPWEMCVSHLAHDIAYSVPFIVGYAKNHQCIERVQPFLADLLAETSAVAHVLMNYNLSPENREARKCFRLLPKIFTPVNKSELYKAGQRLLDINIHITDLPTRPPSIISK